MAILKKKKSLKKNEYLLKKNVLRCTRADTTANWRGIKAAESTVNNTFGGFNI